MTGGRAHALGIDPGKQGGAGLLDESARLVYGWWSWSEHRRKGPRKVTIYETIVMSSLGGPRTFPSQGAAIEAIFAQVDAIRTYNDVLAPMTVGVEGLFAKIHMTKEGKASAGPEPFACSENAGRWMYAIEARGLSSLRPPAIEWRPEVADIPAETERAEAKRLALVRARLRFDWSRVGGFPEMLPKDEREGVCEALFIGAFVSGRTRMGQLAYGA